MTTDTCFWIFQRESFEPADPLCTWAPPTDSLHFSSARARVKTSSTWRFVAPMSHGCCSPCRKFHVSSPDPRFSHHRLIKEPNKSDDDTSMVLLLMMLRFNLILALNLIYIGRYVEIPSSWMQSYWLEWHWSKSGTIVANETRPGDWIESFEIDLSSTYPLPLLLLHLLFLQAPCSPPPDLLRGREFIPPPHAADYFRLACESLEIDFSQRLVSFVAIIQKRVGLHSTNEYLWNE